MCGSLKESNITSIKKNLNGSKVCFILSKERLVLPVRAERKRYLHDAFN